MTKHYSRMLVTGGAGFIGSHIADRLLEEGFEVTIIDNLSTGNPENIIQNQNRKNFHFVQGDIRNWDIVKKTINDVDAVFHLAALVSVPISVQDPLLANDINVFGTLNLLKASLDFGVKRFIYASSAAVYGENSSLLIKENITPNPISPYGASKLAAESYVKSFHRTYGLETVSLRFFNVYGPRQSFDIQNPYSGVITIFLNRLLRNMQPLIYGDGEQTRDFVYVQDVVEANVLALNSKNAVGETFNISSGTRVTVNQVAEALKNLLNRKNVECVHVDARSSDIRHSCADISNAKEVLGYTPKFPFEPGLAELVKWYIGK